jgi:hypothetical protein
MPIYAGQLKRGGACVGLQRGLRLVTDDVDIRDALDAAELSLNYGAHGGHEGQIK